jgi:hypothetical protein
MSEPPCSIGNIVHHAKFVVQPSEMSPTESKDASAIIATVIRASRPFFF